MPRGFPHQMQDVWKSIAIAGPDDCWLYTWRAVRFSKNGVCGVTVSADGYCRAYAWNHSKQIHLYGGRDLGAAIAARQAWDAANPLPFGDKT
jgi:hypothetical protein